ncbi:hypothetical protein WSM22_36220 [Cytophagales bacterium WSM2-2]|nr:hypothetical protein WSM22_36220 [Cytophagales bacterium WSM2-2]
MRLHYKQSLVIVTFLLATFVTRAQNNSVAIGASTADPDAVLLLVANGNQGLIIPKVNLGTAPASFGKAGMIVYNSSDHKVYYYDGGTSSWKTIGTTGTGPSSSGITISGNTISLNGNQTSFDLASPALAGTADQGRLLVWDGTKWSTTPKPTTTDQILKWDNTTGAWVLGTNTSGGIPTLANNQIFVGSAAGVATAVPMSGDAVINNSGALTLVNSANTRTNLGLGSLATLNSPAFGSQNISTTGTLSAGATTLSGLVVSGNSTTLNTVGYTWPGAQGSANTVLTNNGAGILTWAAAGSLPALTANQLLSNNGSNTGITVGGDLTLAVTGTAGAFSIANNAITSAKIIDGTIANADISATAAIAGSKITPAFGTQAITTTGTLAAGATTLSGLTISGNSTSLNGVGYTWPAAQGGVSTVLTNSGTGTLSWAPGLTATLPQNNIFVGNATNVATAVALSNDATIASNGALTIANNAITSAKINDGTIADADISGTAAIAGSKITPAFGTQAITTTGTLAAGATTLSGLTISGNSTSLNGVGYTWPAAQGGVSTVLTNSGTGTLSWAPGLTATLPQNNIFVGNATNVATAVALSNDATIASNGALTIANNAITSAKINDGTIADADISGTAAIAGSKITPAFGTQAITTTGTLAAGATTLSGLTISGNSTSLNGVGYTWPAAQGGVSTVLTNSGTGTLSWAPGLTATLPQNNIFVGNATNVATAVALSNDATIASNGALTIANNAITSAKINDGTIADADISGTAAIAGSKITPAFGTQNISTTGTLGAGAATVTGLTVSGTSTSLNTVGYTWPAAQGTANTVLTNNGAGTLSWAPGLTATLAQNNILVGNATNVATAVAMSGDATIASTGVLTIANNAITSAKINDGTIADADISGTAAIAGSKITPAFGTQNISTTGTLATGAATVSGLTVSGASTSLNTVGYTWPAAQGGVSSILTNNGTGTLSWATSSGNWALTGNAGTTDGTNFIGTTDNIPLSFKVNNQNAGRIDHLLFNSFYGHLAGNSNTTGVSNTAIGKFALQNNTTGGTNTAVGKSALAANNGSLNTGLGSSTLLNNSTGQGNTGVGNNALQSNTIGTNNTALGNGADVANNNLTNATAIGFMAAVSTSNSLVLGGTGANAVKVGIGTTSPVSTLEVTGDITLSKGATRSIIVAPTTSGIGNDMIITAGSATTSPSGSLLLSGGSSTTGAGGNVFIGGGSGVGGGGVFIQGPEASGTPAAGPISIIAGDNVGPGPGGNLTLLGGEADNGLGGDVIMAGGQSQGTTGGNVSITGGESLAGDGGKVTIAAGFGNSSSGSGGDIQILAGSAKSGGGGGSITLTGGLGLSIGNVLLAVDPSGNPLGSVGIGTNSPSHSLEVVGSAGKTTGTTWINTSDRRIKTDIQTVTNGLETIKKLRPVTYRYTDEWRNRFPSIKNQYYYSFIAQEFQKVFPESVEGSGKYLSGDPQEILAIDISNVHIVAVKAIQEQQALIEQLMTESKQLKEANAQLQTKVAALENNKPKQSQLEELKAVNKNLEQRLAAIEAMLSNNAPGTASKTTGSSRP